MSEALLQTIASQAVMVTLKLALPTVLVVMGPWMLNSLLAFTVEIYAQIPQMTAG